MGQRDWTEMGGLRETFLTTHWSLVGEVKRKGGRDQALIGLLLERYWKPVYCYLRRKGLGNEQAKDLTQGFFHEVVLNRHLVERASPAKGSFRSLLLHALRQYVIDQHRKETTRRQIPQGKLISLDLAGCAKLPEIAGPLDPEETFNYAWKADLLERVLGEVKESYVNRGMETHWHVFRSRVLQPTLEDQRAPSLKELCAQQGIEDEARAAHMLDTVKRRFHKTLGKHVRQMVVGDNDVQEELREITAFLKK